MSASILVVDETVTNRIVLKVKLLAARYEVCVASSLSEARRSVDDVAPDLVLVDAGQDATNALAFFQDMRNQQRTRHVPIIAIGGFCGPDARLAALAAGANDVLSKPVHEVMLLARIRSLLRARDAESEIALRDDTSRALGFAEQPETFQGPSRTALIVPDSPAGMLRARGIVAAMPGGARVCSLGDALGPGNGTRDIDLFVIDATCMDQEAFAAEIYRLVPELRSRSESRHAAVIVILPKGTEGMAGMVLDLGANDLVGYDVSMQELVYRAKGLLRRKRHQDRQRATLRNGIKAAITDPLTGLHNRRYAEPHLERLAEAGRRTGRPFAVMVLDIDHFKSINDRWGHAAGDCVLREVAQRLQANVRVVDLLARIGGEEFLLAMPDTTPRLAQMAAERLCNLIEEEPFSLPGSRTPLSVTLSIGVALAGKVGSTVEDLQGLFGRADAALYAAKTAGRNTVSLSAA
ncbi:diguanylate cyclase [Roseisalinus antarcticus]|uniref:diguanylate cyclase n=1 Tax=Roseisalinus antarcticus TaxID=254357 RepID=A0A1Y5RY12_9RHOB|nr:diguanylate cyclase [Roseisalinus antarcticus]SLN28194.1 Response regulator PleD [Roseisalinus antarcticus]